MKICEKCGFQNWEPKEKCEGCEGKFKQQAQCDPMIGGTDQQGHRNSDGVLEKSTYIHLIPQSDER